MAQKISEMALVDPADNDSLEIAQASGVSGSFLTKRTTFAKLKDYITRALGTFAGEDYANAPFINLMADSGKGSDKSNPLASYVPPFSNVISEKWLSSYGGRSPWVEAGKFIYDNATNGGSANSLNQTTSDLLTAMGRTSNARQWGIEFYLAECTSGPANDASDPNNSARFLATMMQPSVQGIFCSNSYATFAAWVRVIDKTSIGLGLSSGLAYKNGVKQATGSMAVVPSDGLVHVRLVRREPMGYATGFPYIYMNPGQKMQIALPAFFHGKVDTGLHSSPLITINELLGVG